MYSEKNIGDSESQNANVTPAIQDHWNMERPTVSAS